MSSALRLLICFPIVIAPTARGDLLQTTRTEPLLVQTPEKIGVRHVNFARHFKKTENSRWLGTDRWFHSRQFAEKKGRPMQERIEVANVTKKKKSKKSSIQKKELPPFFAQKGEWIYNGFVATGNNDWIIYAGGYYDAASLIWAQTMEDGRPDFLMYPMLFCYRHFLELSLKAILIAYVPGEKTTGIPGVKKHRILELWKMVRKLTVAASKEAGESGESEDLVRVDEVVEAFEKLDPDSYTFRYPVDQQHLPVLDGIKMINTQHLGPIMEDVHTTLSGITDFLYEYNRAVDGTPWGHELLDPEWLKDL